MGLTGQTQGGYQTLTVVSGTDVPGPNPVVTPNEWHHFAAVVHGIGGPVTLFMDGTLFGSATFGSTPPRGLASVLLGDLRGGTAGVSYDDVYLGPLPPPQTQLTFSATPTSTGQLVRYTATITPTVPLMGSPTGTVEFTDDGTVIPGCAAAEVLNGSATCTATYANTGQAPTTQVSNWVTADYSGDSDFGASSSEPINLNPIYSGYIECAAPAACSNTGLPAGGGPYTDAEATWTVPTVNATSSCPNSPAGCSKSSTWVGIGGISSNLIQAGTEQDVQSNGQPSYSAWWETVGTGNGQTDSGHEQGLTLNVHGGDKVTVSILLRPSSYDTWDIRVVDCDSAGVCTSASHSVTYAASQQTVEVVHEAPDLVGVGQLPLARTNPVQFGDAFYATGLASSSPSWVPFFEPSSGGALGEFFMTNPAKGNYATPSAPDADNDGFQVSVGTAAPPPPPS